MRLYQRWKCPWCAAVRQALANVGVGCEIVEVPYPRDEREDVLRLTGQARVPVLVDGDEVLVDSRAIVRHLYRRYGGPAYDRSVSELDRALADRPGPPSPPPPLGTDLDEEGVMNFAPGRSPSDRPR